MQYENETDLELCALLLKVRDQIEAAKTTPMSVQERALTLEAYRHSRHAIVVEMNRRLPLQLTVPTLIKWAEISINECRKAENLNNRAA